MPGFSARAVIITLNPWAVLPVPEMTCFIPRELRWLLPASSRVNWRRGNSGQKGTGRDPVLILYSLFPFLLPSARCVPVFCLHTSLLEHSAETQMSISAFQMLFWGKYMETQEEAWEHSGKTLLRKWLESCPVGGEGIHQAGIRKRSL